MLPIEWTDEWTDEWTEESERTVPNAGDPHAGRQLARHPSERPARRRSIRHGLGSTVVAMLAAVVPATIAAADDASLLRRLNEPFGRISEGNKSWRPLFEAIAKVTEPPMPVGRDFNQTTVWPGMADWDVVSEWAKANTALGTAILEVQDRLILGLPYGRSAVPSELAEAGLATDISVTPENRTTAFPYLDGIDLMSTWIAAEMYRLAEAGSFDEAFTLGIAGLKVLRQVADRQMFAEKRFAMERMCEALSLQRDMFWRYLDKIPATTYQRLGTKEYPFLRPTDNERLKRLEMPEGDRLVAEAMLGLGFDDNGQPIDERFEEIFAEIQSSEKPLTRFGAAKRWRAIAAVHGSLDASKERLEDIYDDWWRRWRMRQYDPMQDLDTELSRTNEIRYAAVVLSILDIQSLFPLRNRLIAEINGTVLSAGLCGYNRSFGVWPDLPAKYYAVFAPKRFDFDPYDKTYGDFVYSYLGSDRKPIDTPWGRVWATGCVLYALGDDHTDDGFTDHDPTGETGDFVLWPPTRALARDEGLLN
ncbi:MAG: hypothetical protein ACYTFH_04545 [Planctomycetota bacterium]|jgi:hypothetical protein